MSAVTLAEVALRAGVSQATASRVLSGSSRAVRADHRERVQDAARHLAYSPDLSARAMVMRRSDLVIVVAHELTDADTARVATEIVRGIERSGLTVLLALCPAEDGDCRDRLRALGGYRPRAILVVRKSDHRDSPTASAAESSDPTWPRGVAVVSTAATITSISERGVDATLDDLMAQLGLA